MKVSPHSLAGLWLLSLVAAASVGCTELSARRAAREGNRLYLEGNYAAALERYTEAEKLLPTLPQVVLNKGLACRQLLLPGAKTAENQRLVDCALRAFDRLKQLDPGDARAEQLYVQTLFDADRFETLVEMYQRRLKASPNDLGAINGLIQVSSRAGRWEETLSWTLRRAEVAPRDAEAQYAVGVLIWNRLFQEGGSGPRASFDPRPEANQIPLPFDANDVVGAERVRLADQGITYLERALSIRPNYREAMSYLNLLHRQKSFAFFERPEAWQASMDQAEIWRKKALAAEATHRVRGR